MNPTDKTIRRRELMKLVIASLTSIAAGSLVTEVYHKSFPQPTPSLQGITQRDETLNQLMALSPYPPNTQWFDLVVKPYHKTALPYLELAYAKNSEIILPVKKWNNLGLPMDEDIPFKKPRGEFRIIVYGDSNTEGMCENKDSFPSQLERLLHEQGHKEVRVINAGISASSPFTMVLRHEHVGSLLNPDMVIFAFSMGNDLWELSPGVRKYTLIGQKKGYMEFGPVIIDKKTKRRFDGNPTTAISTELEERVLQLKFLPEQPFTPNQIRFSEATNQLYQLCNQFFEETYQKGTAAQGGIQRLLLSENRELVDEITQRLGYCFWKLSLILNVKKQSPSLKLILLPSPFSTNSPDISSIINGINGFYKESGIKSFEEDKVISIFYGLARQYLGLSTKDLIYPISELDKQNGIFLSQDLHYSPLGNKKIVGILANNIKESLR